MPHQEREPELPFRSTGCNSSSAHAQFPKPKNPSPSGTWTRPASQPENTYLQCKITKVVERPGVHYRGRHSPGSSFVRSACRFLFFFGSRRVSSVDAASSFARSTVSPKKLQILSFFFFCSICFPELALVFPNENFHVHMRTLTAAFSSSFRRGFPLLSPGVIRKCTIFALLQRMIFSRSHCTLALLAFFSPIFLGTFPTFQQTTLLLFLQREKRKEIRKLTRCWLVFFLL